MKISNQQYLAINIPLQKIKKVLSAIIILNILLLFGTWLDNSRLAYSSSFSVNLLFAQFNFAKENVAAAWYSSMLLLVAGLIAALCFITDMQRFTKPKERILNYGWIVVSMIFILLSFDEMGSFHEMIGETTLFQKVGNNKGGGWYAFYALIGLVAVFMISFFIVKFKTNKKALLLTVLAVLLFVSNPLQEKYEMSSWRNSANPDLWRRPGFFLLLEEGSEIFASFCFLYSFTIYLIGVNNKNNNALSGQALNIILKLKSNFIFYLLGLMGFLGALMLLVKFNAWNIAGDDNGIPQNWFPGMMSFLAFLSSMYLYFFTEKQKVYSKRIYLLLAFTGLVTSVFFGSNIYGYRESLISKLPFIFLFLTTITGGVAIIKLPSSPVKIALCGWILFIVLAVFSKDFYPALYGYIAASFLLFSLFLCYQNSQEITAVTGFSIYGTFNCH
jgi:hypothetical protein